MTKLPIFITGTDTDVGKTVISAWLVNQFKMDYWKPIQCGSLNNTDAMQVARLSECLEVNQIHIHPEVYRLTQPLSPHLAARHQNVEINLQQVKIPLTQNRLIIEGAGGVWVPVNRHQNMMDLIKHLGAITLVVSRGTLGTINHTCLTLEALNARSIPIAGVIINGALDSENKQAIEFYGKTQVLAEVPLIKNLNCKALNACKITKLLESRLL